MEENNDGVKFIALDIQESLLKNDNPKTSTKTFIKYRLLKTFFLFISWICLGLFSEILGPALPSLRIHTDSNYEKISRALSVRACGLLFGSLIGGLLSDKFPHNRSFLVFVFLSAAGITVATIPLCTSLLVLSFNLFVSGFSHGAFTTAGNPLLGSLWKKPTGPFNFMHSGYGLGAAIAPILLTLLDTSNNKAVPRNLTLTLNANLTKADVQYLQPSFNIVGILCISVGLVFLLYCFISNPADELEQTFCRRKRHSIVNQNERKGLNRTFLSNLTSSCKAYFNKIDSKMIIIMIICFISYVGIVGNERVFGKFQFSYATEGPLQISKNKGYLINCLYWMAFCVSRIVIAFLAIKIPSKILLVIEICGTVIASSVFTIWNDSQLVFFVSSTVFGFFKSPLFPTMLGVLSLYTPINGVIVILVNFGSAVGAMTCQYLAGCLIEYYGHFTFPIVVTSTAVLLGLIFATMLSITRRWKRC